MNTSVPVQTYMMYASHLLQVNVKMVIYIEKKFLPFVTYYRQGKEKITKIITMDFEHLEFSKYKNTISSIQKSKKFQKEHPEPGSPTGMSADYVIVKNSKVKLLLDASNGKYFPDTNYYWVDMIFARGEVKYFPDFCDWSPRKVMVDILQNKITFIQVDDFNVTSVSDAYISGNYILSGTFFGGSAIAIERYYQCHTEVFEKELLSLGRVDTERAIMVGCSLKHPDLVNLIAARWYDAFSLLY